MSKKIPSANDLDKFTVKSTSSQNVKKTAVCSAKQASEITTLHRDTLVRKSRDPNDDFPQAVELSPGRIVFVVDEIYAWLNRRVAARRVKK